MKQITLKIAAGQAEEIAVVGDYVRIHSASVQVRIEDDANGVDATIEQGDALNLRPFKRLRVSHADASEQAITLLIGNQTSADSARVGGSMQISAFTNNGAAVQSSAAVTVDAQILAANLARGYLALQNIGAADIFFTIDGGTADANGFKLGGGQMIVYDTWVPTGEIRATSSGASTLAYCEA